MRKRILAGLLTGALLLEGVVLPVAAEEASAVGTVLAEDSLIDEGTTSSNEFLPDEWAAAEAAGEELSDWTAEEGELLIEDTAPDELLEETSEADLILEEVPEETITAEVYDPDDKEEIIESAEENSISPEEEILEDTEEPDDEKNAKWEAAENFQRAARDLFASMASFTNEPAMVGTSTQTKNYTASRLKTYISNSTRVDEDGDHYFAGSTKIGGINASAEIYYMELYDAFYFSLKMNQTIDGITYVSELSMTLPYDSAEGADIMFFLDPVSAADPMVAAYAEISAPSSYTASQKLEFNVETLDTDLMDFEIQTLANDMLKAAFTYWNTLLQSKVKVSLTTLRFDRYALTHTHSYKEVVQTKASFTKTGVARQMCSTCSDIKSSTVIKKLGSIKLLNTSFIYNGAVMKPTLIVKDVDGGNISSANYDAVYSNPNSKDPGTYTVKVTMKGLYAGSQTLTYTIGKANSSAPSQPRVHAGFNGSAGIAVQFYKVTGAEYYQIYRKLDKGNWALLKTVKAGDKSLTTVGGRLQYLDASVKSRYGTTFSYSVAARNKYGVSSFDPTGKRITRLKPPTMSAARQSGKDKVVVTWSKVPCRAYELWYCDTSVKPYNYIRAGITTKQTMTVSGLKKGKTYAFRMRCYVAESTSPSKVIFSEYSKYKYMTIK